MKISRIAAISLAIVALSAAATASPILVNFSYTGTGTYVPGETASGSGSFTFDGTNLTAFSFTDTIVNGMLSGTYVYGLSDVSSVAITPTPTGLSDLVIQLQTKQVAGSPSSFGNASFGFSYSAVNPGAGSTAGDGPNFQDYTTGSVTLTQGDTPPPTTPEPATISLAAIALGIGAVGMRRRRSC